MGIVPRAASSHPMPVFEGGILMWHRAQQDPCDHMADVVYVDGSCSKRFDPELNRATWAVTRICGFNLHVHNHMVVS